MQFLKKHWWKLLSVVVGSIVILIILVTNFQQNNSGFKADKNSNQNFNKVQQFGEGTNVVSQVPPVSTTPASSQESHPTKNNGAPNTPSNILASKSKLSATPINQEKTCQTPVFTKHLTELDHVSKIQPLGTPNRPNRTYVGLTQELLDTGGKILLYAPTDVRLVGASWYIHPLLKRPMWALNFDVGCGVTFLLGHVTEVVDKIKAVGPPTPGSSSAINQLATTVHFAPGELIGSNDHGFDFMAQNQTHTNQFANQTRYTLLNHESDFVHAICPYDLFSPELRSTYEAKYGGTHGPFAGATCGQVSHDVPGTISGQWFVNQDPASGVSNGDNLGVNFTSFVEGVNDYARLLIDEGTNNKIHTYSNNPTYKDPAEVRGSYCYQNDNASYYVYAKLASSDIINITSGPGSCPESFPDSGYKTFYR